MTLQAGKSFANQVGPTRQTWPALRSYDADAQSEIALPLGGVGTGTISLGGRGDLRDWEIVNRPAKGFAPENTFLALSIGDGEGPRITRALEGALRPPFSGWMGAGWDTYGVKNHGLPRFRECRFETAYPFGRVVLNDPDVPVEAVIEAFNPLIPGDAEASGLPIAVLRIVLTNRTDRDLDASVIGSMQNFIGTDGTDGACVGNRNEYREDGTVRGVYCTTDGTAAQDPRFGSMAIATLSTDTTHRTAWSEGMFSDSLLDFWDDVDTDGRLDDRERGATAAPMASLAGHVSVPANGSCSVTLLIAWHFPNRMTWNPPAPPAPEANLDPEQAVASAASSAQECCPGDECGPSTAPGWVGNHYTTQFKDAWDVVRQCAPRLAELEERSAQFVNDYISADLPDVVKEAGLFNLTSLRSQTSFRTADGRFYGFEGCGDDVGCCYGSCTHVWNYEPATSVLFGDLARSMREIEFLHATRDDGHMSFRVDLPIEQAQAFGKAAADGQMGCLVKLYRDWQLCGDDNFLRTMWPKAKAAMSFAWIEGGWDANQDGVMEGCQHNTMDVEYHGPNPQMGGWYLAALRASEEMAKYLQDEEFAARCRSLFERGSAWMDEHLFNGEYYEHHVEPPANASAIAEGLAGHVYDEARCADPPHQLGAGCLVDQLVGQYLAHVAGLGHLLNPDNVRTTLQSIYRYNRREGMWGHFNHFRSFALSDESALLMASFPRGNRPRVPFPYYNEVMTGFEYTAAVGMIYEGMLDEGLQVITDVRARHDGARRNPFNEPECGHHYARAMTSFGATLAMSGHRWSAVDGRFTIKATAGDSRFFWSNGAGWGTVQQRPLPDGVEVEILVREGEIELETIELLGEGELQLPRTSITSGTSQTFTVTRAPATT